MTGHLLGAAGGVEAIFSVLALHTRHHPADDQPRQSGRRLRPRLRAATPRARRRSTSRCRTRSASAAPTARWCSSASDLRVRVSAARGNDSHKPMLVTRALAVRASTCWPLHRHAPARYPMLLRIASRTAPRRAAGTCCSRRMADRCAACAMACTRRTDGDARRGRFPRRRSTPHWRGAATAARRAALAVPRRLGAAARLRTRRPGRAGPAPADARRRDLPVALGVALPGRDPARSRDRRVHLADRGSRTRSDARQRSRPMPSPRSIGPRLPTWQRAGSAATKTSPACSSPASRRILDYLAAGDVFQVNLSRGWRRDFDRALDPAALYARLRDANPAPFAGLFAGDGLGRGQLLAGTAGVGARRSSSRRARSPARARASPATTMPRASANWSGIRRNAPST